MLPQPQPHPHTHRAQLGQHTKLQLADSPYVDMLCTCTLCWLTSIQYFQLATQLHGRHFLPFGSLRLQGGIGNSVVCLLGARLMVPVGGGDVWEVVWYHQLDLQAQSAWFRTPHKGRIGIWCQTIVCILHNMLLQVDSR